MNINRQSVTISLILIKCRLLLLIILTGCATYTNANQTKPLRIAVAANFYPVLKNLQPLFELKTTKKIELISGATGTLYQQIMHGAPFDIFLSADAIRPQNLVNQGIAQKSSLNTYAVGQLALWSATQTIYNIEQLQTHTGKLAIANPEIAPYGMAAKQAISHLGLWHKLNKNLITGININQTFQQVRSGSVKLGIVAKSQLVLNKLQGVDIPAALYSPLQQKAVIIKRTKQPQLAEQFMAFLMSYSVQNQLENYGYQSAIISKTLTHK